MIELDNYFFSEVDKLYDALFDNESKEDLFNNCVKERMSNVLIIQSNYFDEQLKSISNIIDGYDFRDINNIKKLSNALKSLHKCIARDRLSLIEHLLRII